MHKKTCQIKMTSVADLRVNNMHMKNLTFDKFTRIMDWRDEEIDQSNVDSFSREEKGLPKSKSYLNLPEIDRDDIHSEKIKESMCLTSAFQSLKLDAEINHDTHRSSSPQTKDAKNSHFKYNFETKSHICGFRTHEKCSYRLVFQGPEILNYQGTLHSPEDVASYWKKDSRMWLWKSVRYDRRKNKAKYLMNQRSSKNRLDGFKQRGSPSERNN